MNDIKDSLKENKIKPSKKLGQNFLIDEIIVKKIISSAEIKSDDIVLEIGPGTGVLTKEIAKKAKKVIAIEKDKGLIDLLKESLKNFKNAEIICADILSYDFRSPNFKIIANIPYYITSPLIRKFLESENRPKEMILMVQKEVAQRISANPPNMSLLSVSAQFYADIKILFYVSKKCFLPSPKVDSAVIKIIPKKSELNKNKNFRILFFKIVKAGFLSPRKQIINNLSKGLDINKENTKDWLLKNNIEPKRRAETLSLKEWANLALSIQVLKS